MIKSNAVLILTTLLLESCRVMTVTLSSDQPPPPPAAGMKLRGHVMEEDNNGNLCRKPVTDKEAFLQVSSEDGTGETYNVTTDETGSFLLNLPLDIRTNTHVAIKLCIAVESCSTIDINFNDDFNGKKSQEVLQPVWCLEAAISGHRRVKRSSSRPHPVSLTPSESVNRWNQHHTVGEGEQWMKRYNLDDRLADDRFGYEDDVEWWKRGDEKRAWGDDGVAWLKRNNANRIFSNKEKRPWGDDGMNWVKKSEE